MDYKGLTMLPGILRLCSCFAGFSKTVSASFWSWKWQRCHILGLVVFLVLSYHCEAENEVQRKPSLSRWPVNLGPPTCNSLMPLILFLGGTCCSTAWKENKRKNKKTSLTFVFSPPSLLFQEKKPFRAYVTIWSWPLLDRKLNGMCHL